ncbi:alpha/beta fold hydrolase [Streptomyces kunmingensis]|uniref:Alpha/beta fold hydrolase n=1 Tax=Streptomyces kunmingensis TaxID=68225 RepID=A0ABU6CN85_9ACTN|nr:alpha/beta fold hydrolase [Streptomyces kunmingensis]MEB3966189.1 alpha/beta fold hydrolase [Streptomyces kunmingensis]
MTGTTGETWATDETWFPPCRPVSAPPLVLDADAVQLFCLPHAGAGASAYRDWPDALAPGIEVIPVQLPGRESRHREPARRSAAELVGELTGPLASRAGPDYALFGHSMGALLSYELAHALSALGKPPRHLFVSGLGGPHLPFVGPLLHEKTDAELITAVAAMEGTSAEVLAVPELVELLLPLLRADLTVWETYEPRPRASLRVPVPITALGGRQDPGVGLDRLGAWQELTSAGFRAEVFDGGHFYHHDAPDEVAAVVRRTLLEPSPVR